MNCFPISDKGPVGLEVNTVVPHLILLPLTLWMAVVVTKLVDIPSVTLSKKLFGGKKWQMEHGVAASWEMEAMLSQNEGHLPR